MAIHLQEDMQVIGAPLAASLLALDGFCGLAGWQWLFLVEGFPTILLGIWINRSLAHSPSTAPFLTPAEKTWLLARHESQKVRILIFHRQDKAPCLTHVEKTWLVARQGSQRMLICSIVEHSSLMRPSLARTMRGCK